MGRQNAEQEIFLQEKQIIYLLLKLIFPSHLHLLITCKFQQNISLDAFASIQKGPTNGHLVHQPKIATEKVDAQQKYNFRKTFAYELIGLHVCDQRHFQHITNGGGKSQAYALNMTGQWQKNVNDKQNVTFENGPQRLWLRFVQPMVDGNDYVA